MKVHWQTYNYCLFVAYLASVAIRYGWILDIKFQKFLDEDWIWICKNFFVYRSGVKTSISAHLCVLGSIATAVFFLLDLGFFCFIWGSGIFIENQVFF